MNQEFKKRSRTESGEFMLAGILTLSFGAACAGIGLAKGDYQATIGSCGLVGIGGLIMTIGHHLRKEEKLTETESFHP